MTQFFEQLDVSGVPRPQKEKNLMMLMSFEAKPPINKTIHTEKIRDKTSS